MFENCITVNDYIESIFRIGLQQRDAVTIDNVELYGFYLKVPYKKIDDSLSCWEILFINLKAKSGKIYGNNDTENTFADCLLWATECLQDILEGNNENFPIEQGIETLLTTRGEEIVKYIQKYVDLQIKNFIKANKRLYHIEVSLFDNYDYLAEVSESNNGEDLVQELLEGNILTKKQRDYLETITTSPNYIKDGAVYDESNQRIYSQSLSAFYKKKLREAVGGEKHGKKTE